MNVFSTARLTALVLGLSLSAMACSQETANDEGATSAAAQTEVHAGPIAHVSPDGVAGARALLSQTSRLVSEHSSSETFVEWLGTKPSHTFYVHEDGRPSFYFLGDVLGPDATDARWKTLEVKQTSPHPFMGPGYLASMLDGDGTIPHHVAKRLEGIDSETVKAIAEVSRELLVDPSRPALRDLETFLGSGVYVDAITVQKLSENETAFSFHGSTIHGGDEVSGSADLELVRATNEGGLVGFAAKTRIQLDW